MMKTAKIFIYEAQNNITFGEDILVLVRDFVVRFEKHGKTQYSYDLWCPLDKLALLAADSVPDSEGNSLGISFLNWTEVGKWEEKVKNNSIASESLSDSLHSLADSLPKYGVKLQVTWIRDQKWPDVKNDLELFGALKRLSCWHNAHIQLVHMEDVMTGCEMMQTWARLLLAETCSLKQFKQQSNFVTWNGSINMYPHEGEEATVLPGITLTQHHPYYPRIKCKATGNQNESCDEKFYDNHMDFIALVDVRDIPSFYITDTLHQVCVNCQGSKAKKSKKFLELLKGQPNSGYLVRLSHGTSWKVAQKTKRFMSKSRDWTKKEEEKNWTDIVRDNLLDVYKSPHNIQLGGDRGYDHFLLTRGRTCRGEDVITACKLRNPKDINGHMAHVLTMLQDPSVKVEDNKENNTEFNNMEREFERVPHYHSDTWLQLEEQIQEAQLYVLQQWKDQVISETGDDRMHADDIYRLLQGTRQQFMEMYTGQFGEVTTQFTDGEHLQFVEQTPEHQNPYRQLERLVMMYNSAQESRMARFQSSDSLGGLSPPSKGQVLKLDAGEFLKHFGQDGTAKKQKLSTLQVKKVRLNKFDSGEVKETKWPECSHYKFHDIYYNVGKTPEKREEKSSKLKTWLQSVETCSTCNVETDNKPETILVKQQLLESAKKSKKPARKSCVTPPHKITSGRKRTISIETPPKSASAKRKRTQTPLKQRKTPLKTTPVATSSGGGGSANSNKKPVPYAKRKRTQTPLKQRKAPLKTTPVATSSGGGGSANRNKKPVHTKASAAADGSTKESRSQRHKRKLEDAVITALKAQGIKKSEDKALFKACFHRLYTLSYSFVKDLRGYTSLTEEMNNIAMMQAPTVVHFERRKHNKNKAK